MIVNQPDELQLGSDPPQRSETSGLTRRCAMCLQWKTISEFHNSRTGEFTYCRDCRNAYDRLYYATRGKAARSARRRAAIDEARKWMATLKEGMPCADCGHVFPVYVMHWDHLPGFEKIGEISTMVAHRNRETVLEELGKCQLVCANCHVMRTVGRARRVAH